MARDFLIPRTRLGEFCRRHQIRKLAFFGSVLRPDFRPESDVDVPDSIFIRSASTPYASSSSRLA